MGPRGAPPSAFGGIGRLGVYACGPGGQRRPVPMDPGAGAPAAPESTTASKDRGKDRGRGPKGEPTPGAVARRGDNLCPAHSDSRGRTPSDRPGCTRFRTGGVACQSFTEWLVGISGITDRLPDSQTGCHEYTPRSDQLSRPHGESAGRSSKFPVFSRTSVAPGVPHPAGGAHRAQGA